MASKSDRFYYENLVSAADYSCKAAEYLVECLTSYNPLEIKDMLSKMHDIEHNADKKKHEMSAALAKAFVTPVDREDLAELSHKIDDVIDRIEEILQRFYIDEISEVTEDAIAFAKKILETTILVKALMAEFENFKKPAKLQKLIIDVSNAEEDCDQLYLEAALNIRKDTKDVLKVVAWRKIYDHMENCVDSCENVADAVGTVVMKNT